MVREAVTIQWPEEPGWHLGVTGSRYRRDGGHYYPSPRQKDALRTFLHEAVGHGAKYLHHGCCTGWDEDAVRITQNDRLPLLIHGHQPDKEDHLSKLAIAWSNVLYTPQPYRDRNQDITDASHLMFAGPQYPETHPRSQRSGTWMTVRMGRNAGLHVYACDQFGNITDEKEANV